ncbi:MAG: four helix bundle protein [Burkholderiales bacterium]|nr:four helix bundle protein [Burkholderiales bacterium]
MARDTYELTKAYPKDEQYGIVSQMKRSAVSIASNIAEGAARQGNKEFLQFLYIALGSASELDTQIEISRKIGLGDSRKLDELQNHLETISKMLQGLIRSIKSQAGS